ncbi:MAG: type II toxin-antitoxin system VapC family toxin [Candidatus Diapherotrites archaeon]|nr:type II toxin-antitoxin system VapC family toxin [Candidatus Diapherotrites archaeon]
MIFVDTVTLFSSFFVDEKNHVQAKKIILAIAEGKLKNAVFSDYVLDELLTLSRSKKNPSVSNSILEELLDSEIELIKVEHKHLLLAFEIFKKYERLSFTDATTVALMLDLGINQIYSFDKGFDTVPKITRLEEI